MVAFGQGLLGILSEAAIRHVDSSDTRALGIEDRG
jgi:hypothetical protein